MSILANVLTGSYSPRATTPLSPTTISATPPTRFAALFSSPPPQEPAQKPSAGDFTVEEVSDSETLPLNTQVLYPYATEEASDTASESDATSGYPDPDTAVSRRIQHLRCTRIAGPSSPSGKRKRARTLDSAAAGGGTEDRDTMSEPEPPRTRRRLRAPNRNRNTKSGNHVSSLDPHVESEMSDAPPQLSRPFWASEDSMDVDGQAA